MSKSAMSVLPMALFAGCFTLPSDSNGPYRCEVSPRCPPGQVCVQGTCMEDPVTLAMEVVGGGTVTSTSSGISCSGRCEAVFERGAQITLVAAAAAPLAFTGWSEACAASESDCTLTLTADMAVGATFAIPAWIVTTGAIGHESTGGHVGVSGDHVVFTGRATIEMSVGGKVVPQPGPFIAKLDPVTRDAVWIRSPGGAYISAVAVDAAGNSLVAGSLGADIDLTTLIKHDATGNELWKIDIGQFTYVHSIGVDAAGDIYLGGKFLDTVDFGGGPVTALGVYDMFIARYRGNTGAYVWAKTFGGVDFDLVADVVVDQAGAVAFSGQFRDRVDFDGNVLAVSGTEFDYDGVFGKLDAATGAMIFAKKIGSVEGDLLSQIAADTDGNLYVSGYVSDAPVTGEPLSRGAFVAKYTAQGAHLWSRKFLNSEPGLAVDSFNDLIATGTFIDAESAGNGITLTSAGGYDVFVAKLSGNTGDTVWAKRFGGPQADVPMSIAIDAVDRIYTGGFFSAFAEFEHESVPAIGIQDLFLFRLEP